MRASNRFGPVKIYAQNYLQAPAEWSQSAMKASSRAVSKCFMFIYFFAPLRARYMAKPGADQHQSRVAVRERSHHAGSAADLTVQLLNHVVGTDARPMLTGKIAVDQSFLNAVLDLLGSLLQLHGAQSGNDRFSLVAGRLYAGSP